MSNSREEILHIVRKGLKNTRSEVLDQERDFTAEAQEIQQLTKKKQNDLRSQFISEIQNVNTRVIEVSNEEHISKLVLKLAKDKELKSFSIWESQFLKDLKIKEELKRAGLKLVTAKNKNRIAASDIGITEVNYAIADTGTLVLLSNKNQPRSVSLLPPIHLAIVQPENLVRNIRDLFVMLKSELEQEQDITSCMTFITGPSRTADIELNLTLGVHGPKELYVVI